MGIQILIRFVVYRINSYIDSIYQLIKKKIDLKRVLLLSLLCIEIYLA